jgi:hypothetical protein
LWGGNSEKWLDMNSDDYWGGRWSEIWSLEVWL